MSINDLITKLLQEEGGYTDNPADKGGPTNWGITEAVARAYGYTGSMALLPRDTAAAIYRQRYWLAPKFADVGVIAPAIADELLDTGVNMGVATAGKFLQRALNTLNDQGKLFPDLTMDGGIGAMTLDALRQYVKSRGDAGVTVLLRMMNAQQSVRYMEIAEANKDQEAFEYGWQANRVS